MEETNEEDVFSLPNAMDEADELEFIDAAMLGKDYDTFNVFNNEVSMHTLTIRETLEASRIAKAYSGTKAEWIALKTAIVALSIDDINGVPFYESIRVDEPIAQRRFKLLSDNYYSDFVSACYEKYSLLENRQRELLDKLKKAQA